MTSEAKPTSAKRTHLYIALVLIAAVTGFFYSVRTNGIFACQAPLPGSDSYIGTCNVTNVGDYDHGAFWFDLEPTAVSAAASAEVLIVGNSRMQFGLSTPQVRDWFHAQSLSFYLLGFSHSETWLFVEPLLRKIEPAADILVINVDGFFDDRLTGPANTLLNEADAQQRYKEKFRWLAAHSMICGKLPSICGNASSYVRNRADGTWTFNGADFLARMDFSNQIVDYDSAVNEDLVSNYQRRAGDFISSLDFASGCVILTNIPNSDTTAGDARALAARLELPLIAPELPGLTTFDGSHLDPASASRWSEAFLEQLAPLVRQCQHGSGA